MFFFLLQIQHKLENMFKVAQNSFQHLDFDGLL